MTVKIVANRNKGGFDVIFGFVCIGWGATFETARGLAEIALYGQRAACNGAAAVTSLAA